MKWDTHSLSEEDDVGFHQSSAPVASRDPFLLNQPSDLGGIKRRLAINTPLRRKASVGFHEFLS